MSIKESYQEKVLHLLNDVMRHSGYGEIRIDVKWVKQGHKEVVITAGKQYRYVVPIDEK